MSLGIGGLTTFKHKLVDNVKVPVCSTFTANDYNMYGDCPADGRYMFDSSYRFPAPSSGFMDWASSGYQGEIVLDIFFQKQLVGRCSVGAETMVTGSYDKSTFASAPSGKAGAIAALTLLGLFVFYVLYSIIRSCRAKRKARAKTLPSDATTQDLSTDYSRMEAGNDPVIKGSFRPLALAENASVSPRYACAGPVI